MGTCILTGADNCSVYIRGDYDTLFEWVRRYIDPWWPLNCTSLDRPLVTGSLDQSVYADVSQYAKAYAESQTMFWGSSSFRASVDNLIVACSPARELAYAYCLDTGSIDVWGVSEQLVAFSTARMAWSSVVTRLECQGWLVLHAGCVLGPYGGVLVLGAKASGKTSTCLSLAQMPNHQILSNDRCLIRLGSEGLEVIALPGSVTIGLGLLKALGWDNQITRYVLSGTEQHPVQQTEVTQAIRKGCYEPILDTYGRELKFHLFARDLHQELPLEVVHQGRISQVIFPSVSLTSSSQIERHQASFSQIARHILTDGQHFLLPTMLDSDELEMTKYRTVCGLLKLPQYRVTLGADPMLNAQAFLKRLLK